MSDKATPSPTVSEETGRKAIDDLTRRVVDTQVKAGVPVPGGRVVEDWVRPIVEKTIRKHEETFSPASPRDEDGTDARPRPEGKSPDRIGRGDTGVYEPIVREFDEQESPLAKRHMNPRVMPIEDMRLLARLNLILKEFPEFARRIHREADDATQRARNDGMTDDDPRMLVVRRDAVLKMAELSGAPVHMGGLGLGDYKVPKAGGPTKLYFQGPNGKLIPAPTDKT